MRITNFAAAVVVLALTAGTAQAAPPADPVQKSLDTLVADLPGALAAVRGTDGRTRDYTAGVGDTRTGAPVPVQPRRRTPGRPRHAGRHYRLAGSCCGEGSYRQDALNLAFGKVGANVFQGMPSRRVDERAALP